MQVSVAIPAFNGADYLREAIESVLAQTIRPIEILVVDDGSTDHTRAVCESFGPEVRYIYQENDGTMGGTARSLAITEAKSDWVALLDQDDRWLATKIEKQVAVISEFPDVGAVFTRYQVITHEGNQLEGVSLEKVTRKTTRLSAEDAFHLLLKGNPYCPSSVLLNRKIFDLCGYADVHDPGCGDWDTWLRIARHFPIALVDEYLTEYRINPAGSCRNKHFLASALELTLDRQKLHLHPNCKECETAYRAGKKHVAGVFRVAARTYLDQYTAAALSGQKSQAVKFMWKAMRAAPQEALRPRRFLAAIKNFTLGTAAKPKS